MEDGFLPVRYLGVPLISKKLFDKDCDALIQKISCRIDSWLPQHLTLICWEAAIAFLGSVQYSDVLV